MSIGWSTSTLTAQGSSINSHTFSCTISTSINLQKNHISSLPKAIVPESENALEQRGFQKFVFPHYKVSDHTVKSQTDHLSSSEWSKESVLSIFAVL